VLVGAIPPQPDPGLQGSADDVSPSGNPVQASAALVAVHATVVVRAGNLGLWFGLVAVRAEREFGSDRPGCSQGQDGRRDKSGVKRERCRGVIGETEGSIIGASFCLVFSRIG